ncbi:MAG: glycosyltransferase family 39 protein [Candidatus Curtissbacteria bacterium]|nr:glycosyltransferase family 39 protein [Candidatus Curtissbacteria bacterium]
MESKKFLLIFVVIITIFSFALRIFRLNEPGKYYYDEVYHVVTARAYSQNNPAAYDPFAPAPEKGTAFDWLHPPLAKLIQAGSIKVLGDKPLGWRLPSAIFGTGIIVATFFLAYVLFGPTAAVFASSVIAFENLTFVMSRITMNDVFVTFFVILSFLFSYLYVTRNKLRDLLLASIILGLAVSSKWTGAYAIGACFIFILSSKLRAKQYDLRLILLIVIPPLIYLASYGQFWLQGHSIRQFIDLNKQIWWYQNRHDLEHSYGTTPLYCVPKGLSGAKTWCPWILDARGVYFSYEQYGEKAGYIYALGNPLIFWSGVLAVSYCLGLLIEQRKKEYALLLFGYFIFWLPWIFSPRIMFLSHYLPAIPFLSISLGVVMAAVWKTHFKYISIVVLLIFAAVFFYFYPISSGWPIKPASIDSFMWLKTWR